MTAPSPQKQDNKSIQEKEVKPTALESVVELFKANFWDSTAYIILAISLIFCFFDPFLGGLPVGFILGIYFSSYVFQITASFREFLTEKGIFKAFILIAATAAFIISAPGISLGLLIGTFSTSIFTQKEQIQEKKEEDKNSSEKE